MQTCTAAVVYTFNLNICQRAPTAKSPSLMAQGTSWKRWAYETLRVGFEG